MLIGLCEIHKVALSENYSYRYKADHTLFFEDLREKRQDIYWPIVTFISRVFLLVDRQYV